MINKVTEMLKKGPLYCLKELRKFSVAVQHLNLCSCTLTSKEHSFLHYVTRYRDQMRLCAPLISFVEKESSQNQKAVADLLYQMSSVKEIIRMHKTNLAGYIHDYEVSYGQTTKPCDLEKLQERIEKIKNGIHEDTTMLVVKTITLKTLEAEMKHLEEDISALSKKAEFAESYRQDIYNFWSIVDTFARHYALY
ncbi:hypothetical protein QL285_038505 [Trifolium repens]|nr:hypothetical protein QL285_038505 [Trifolium repens]